MCELLIQAKGHWMDDFTQEQIDALDDSKKASRNARIQLGDIVVIKPNGWVWGREETLPNYYIIKVPNISVEEAEYATQSLMDNTDPEKPVMLKKRKYQIPQQIINQLNNNDGVITTQVDSTWLANLIAKVT